MLKTSSALLIPLVCLLIVSGCNPPQETAVSKDYISGQVTSASGQPEAGVWVIAETDVLPTAYRKIVVTDETGKFLVPGLPDGNYQVWARGYGLRDSSKQSAAPGAELGITTETASAIEAATNYPASYWLSLLEAPAKDAHWIDQFKLGCQLCHQVGSLMTRSKNREALDIGLHKATYMNGTAEGLGREKLLDAMTDWYDRISKGETPPAPPRPTGVERNLVITQWAWGDTFTYAHDEIATDKRNPRLYANQPIYGVDIGNDHLLVLDPLTHEASKVPVPTLNGFETPWCSQTFKPLDGDAAIPVGFGSLGCPTGPGITGFEGQYPNPANPHNPMMDDAGRVWFTTQVRREWAQDSPAFCKSSPVITGNYHHRQLGVYDPATGKQQLLDTCYGTHHLQFDDDGVLWMSGDSYVIGWFDPEKYDADRPESLARAQGWSEVIVDSDGDGTADAPLVEFNYGIIPNPVDNSVWTAQPGGAPGEFRGRLIRYDPASDTHESYAPPAPGSGPRGVDVDSKGIIWVALGASGHLGRFDRSLCDQHWGLGDQCSAGWKLYRSPGPVMRTGTSKDDERGADFHYYLFVDQFNTLGLGKDIVIMNGTGSDSLLAFDPKSEAFTIIRIPYPLNTFTRGLDGRIDDPDVGWKGRGLWFTNGLDPLIHSEIQQSFVGKVQLRPNPLAY